MKKLWQDCEKIPRLVFVFIIFLIVIFYSLDRKITTLYEKVGKLEQIAGLKKVLCDEKEVIEKSKRSLVRIIGKYVQGSGFFVGSSGRILTNFHVINFDPNPKVILPDYSIVQGEVIAADKKSDLALIQIPKKNLPVLEFGNSSELEPMEELISLGYPLGNYLQGEATVIKGRFVSLRFDKEMNINLIQTDMSLNSGASGGPMIDACGKVVGVNVTGGAGLSMGISMSDIDWNEIMNKENPVEEVEKIEIKPNESPEECVKAFYNYQTIGALEKAYGLLSSEYTTWTFDQWKEGYKNTLNIVLYETKEDNESMVFVKFSSADFDGKDFIYRYFEGTHEAKEINGELKLFGHNIKEVEDPDWEWFFLPTEEK